MSSVALPFTHTDTAGDEAHIVASIFHRGVAFVDSGDSGVYVTAEEAPTFARAVLAAAGVTDYVVAPRTEAPTE